MMQNLSVQCAVCSVQCAVCSAGAVRGDERGRKPRWECCRDKQKARSRNGRGWAGN